MIRNLVFKGGGVRGLAYAGSLSVLEQHGIIAGLQRIAGTSAGAITALLVALKYTAEEIHQIILSMDFKTFEDDWNPINIITKYGLYKGAKAQAWIESLVASKTGANATFADLHNKGFLDLHVVATQLSTQNSEIFSYDTTPNVIVSEAVRASMSIPFFFWAMQVNGMQDLYVDGGEQWNYPIDIFDTTQPNQETLGLYLTDLIPTPPTIIGYNQLIKCVKLNFESALASQDVDVEKVVEDMKRSVKIDGKGISATDFTLSSDQKLLLYNSGIDCTNKFLQSWPMNNSQGN